MVEITILVGFWNMWNRFTDTFKIDLEQPILDTAAALDVTLPGGEQPTPVTKKEGTLGT